MLPAASVARTWKVCEPSPTPLYAFGEAHDENEDESSAQAKLTPPSGDENENDGDESFDGDDVSYHWFRDDLMFTLHVALVAGITREAADAMADSIR